MENVSPAAGMVHLCSTIDCRLLIDFACNVATFSRKKEPLNTNDKFLKKMVYNVFIWAAEHDPGHMARMIDLGIELDKASVMELYKKLIHRLRNPTVGRQQISHITSFLLSYYKESQPVNFQDLIQRLVALAIMEKNKNILEKWVQTGYAVPLTDFSDKPSMTFNSNTFRTFVSYSPDGNQIAFTAYDGIQIWNPKTGLIIRTLCESNGCTGVRYSPDGKYIAAGSNSTNIWDAKTGLKIRSINRSVYMCAFCPLNSRWIAFVNGIGHLQLVEVYDIENGTLFRCTGSSKRNYCYICYSSDGEKILCGDYSGDIDIWHWLKMPSSHRIKAESSAIGCISYSPNNKIFASVNRASRIIKLWDAETETLVKCFFCGGEQIHDVVFSPDSKCLASANNKGVIQIWDIDRGIVVKELFLGNSPTDLPDVLKVCYSPDGKKIAASGTTSCLKIWDLMGTVENFRGLKFKEIKGNDGVKDLGNCCEIVLEEN